MRPFSRVFCDPRRIPKGTPAPGERSTVTLARAAADPSFWDATTGRMVVEAARHKVMIGRSATDIRGCATLSLRGERITAVERNGTEIETQFRALDNTQNLMRSTELRMMGLLWDKVYHQRLPEFFYAPGIARNLPN